MTGTPPPERDTQPDVDVASSDLVIRSMTGTDDLLARYDAEVRDTFRHDIPAGWTSVDDGPLTRCLTLHGGFALAGTAIAELSTTELAALVGRTVAYYAERAVTFEWKTFDHDPPDLVPLLIEHGLVAEEHESLVLGRVEALLDAGRVPPGLTLRPLVTRADLDRVAALESQVWDEDCRWLADDLAGRVGDTQDSVLVYGVEDGSLLVAAAWLAPMGGGKVAGLWGGSTLAEYRGRGVYRALVAARARAARARGIDLVQVDASEDSRPILERLGLQTVGGTTPFRWRPPA